VFSSLSIKKKKKKKKKKKFFFFFLKKKKKKKKKKKFYFILIASICAALQIKSFAKWSKSYCILKDLIKSIILLLNRVLNIHVFYIRINK